MKSSPAKTLFFLFVFGSSVGQLQFSFHSQYDGYIYPSWKKKEGVKGLFYEDAVVVGKDFMVLGAGVEGTKGLTGFFSYYQCLSVAKEFENFAPESVNDVTDKVYSAYADVTSDLGLYEIEGDKRDVATTLVYMKLNENTLFTGVVGNSGFSIYRYNPDSKIIELVKESKKNAYDSYTSRKISADTIDPPVEDTHDVLEGDVVMAASNGVLDVLPSSFLTAATNYLVARMIEKKRNHKSLDELDYDYEYDMAEFVELYVQNLKYFSTHLRKVIMEKQSQLNTALESNQSSNQDQLLKETKEQSTDFSSENSELKKSDMNLSSDNENLNHDLSVSELHSEKQIDELMKEIFQFEICNLFDPTDGSMSFKSLLVYGNVIELVLRNFKQNEKKPFKPIDCFRNKKIEKTTVHDSSLSKWTCKNISDLNNPIQSIESNFKNFDQCVLEAIPKLPDNITPKEIAEAFNSRYFARNIALALKYISNDPRIGAEYILFKGFFGHLAENVLFSDENMEEARNKWRMKLEDVSIAAAAIRNSNKQTSFENNFELHYTALKSVFKSLTNQKLSNNII